ncbi:Na+/H+ antiporter NhaA [Solidesulfovibrio sp.]
MENPSHTATQPMPLLEQALHPWVSYGIMPLFALANAGVPLTGSAAASIGEPVFLGIFLGLFVGKRVGIFLACFAMFRRKLTGLPDGMRLSHYYGASTLARVSGYLVLRRGAPVEGGNCPGETEQDGQSPCPGATSGCPNAGI